MRSPTSTLLVVVVPLALALASPSIAPARADAPPAAKPPATPAHKVISVGQRPESVTRGFGGALYVTVMNDAKTPGDGVVKVIEGDTAKDFATGLDEPKGICFTGKLLVTTDVKRVWKIDAKGTKEILADEKAFPEPLRFLNDTACAPDGKAVYVTDMGANDKMRDPSGALWPVDSPEGKALPTIGRVYRVGLDGKVTMVQGPAPEMPCPNGVSTLRSGGLLVGEFFTGNILESKAGKLTVLASGYRGADGVVQAKSGDLYISSWTQGKLWRLDSKGKHEVLLLEGLQSAADFFLDEPHKQILQPDMKAGTLTFVPLK
jgi:hypothetical protein